MTGALSVRDAAARLAVLGALGGGVLGWPLAGAPWHRVAMVVAGAGLAAAGAPVLRWADPRGPGAWRERAGPAVAATLFSLVGAFWGEMLQRLALRLAGPGAAFSDPRGWLGYLFVGWVPWLLPGLLHFGLFAFAHASARTNGGTGRALVLLFGVATPVAFVPPTLAVCLVDLARTFPFLPWLPAHLDGPF